MSGLIDKILSFFSNLSGSTAGHGSSSNGKTGVARYLETREAATTGVEKYLFKRGW